MKQQTGLLINPCDLIGQWYFDPIIGKTNLIYNKKIFHREKQYKKNITITHYHSHSKSGGNGSASGRSAHPFH